MMGPDRGPDDDTECGGQMGTMLTKRITYDASAEEVAAMLDDPTFREAVLERQKVLRGSVRTYSVLNDGRRHIGAFYLPGDVFGVEPPVNINRGAEAGKGGVHCLLETAPPETLAH